MAKRRGNHDSLYGSKLYIQYAPDFETVDVFREKMRWRAKRVNDAVCKDSKIIGENLSKIVEIEEIKRVEEVFKKSKSLK